MAVPALPDLNVLPAEELRTLILVQHEQLLSREREIEHLQLLLIKLHRMQFERKSEKLQRQIEQLELRLEELESNCSEQVKPSETSWAAAALSATTAKPARRALPDHLPRQTRTHVPKERVCPQCQGELRKLGEDVSEVLEYVPASFVVIRHVRPKLSCTKCDGIVQAEAPSRPIERGLAGPGLLAHVLVSKYCDHQPLYRQSEIYARQGVELERSTMADWVGASSRLLEPLVEALRRYVTAAGKLHADDTPVPVLAPGQGKTKTGRLWTYVRDDRPAGDTAAPAVWFAYSPDRKGEHPERHLQKFRGTLQADAYAGFNQLYEDGRIAQAACWAHVRRHFYDLEQAHASPVAREALARIGTLYGIEEQLRGKPPNERRAVRRAEAKPLVDSLRQWFEATLSKLSRKSETTVASAGARPVKIEVAESPAKSIELDKSEINQAEQTAESFLQRFNGQIGVGSIYNRGNQSVQYNLNANATYPRERWSAAASFSSNLSSSNGAPVSTRNDLELTGLRRLNWNNWYYAGLAKFLQSTQQGISLQSTFGGGVGRYLKRTNNASLTLTGGFAWQQINYHQNVLPSTTQQVVSALVVSQLQLYSFDKTNLDVTGMVLPALSDPGRVHFNLNAAYYVKLWRKLSWNVTFYGNWDNHPPIGFASADYGSSSGISWKFGNK